jgi:hypothetical protein
LFEWAVSGLLPWSRVVALAALMALVPAGFAMPALALSGAAGLIVVGLACGRPLATEHACARHAGLPCERRLFTAI